MKITKIGHCCLIIETKGKRIVTDPGSYSIEGNANISNVNYVLFTHEHQDHYHLDSLKTIIKNNPDVQIFANSSVSELLTKENINHKTIKHGDAIMLGEIKVEGIGEKHAIIHSSIPQSQNIGFFIDEKLWYPGDAFTNPNKKVDILALPVAGPWMKISEAIDYALELKPRLVFPVHDGILVSPGMSHRVPPIILDKYGIKFIPIEINKEQEF